MSENIIYIKGAARPRTHEKVLAEMLDHHDLLNTARIAGHNVTRVGTAWGGFYMSQIRRAFEQPPNANLVIINAHGNIKDKKHFMAKGHGKATHIWADDFYKALAEFSGNRPLNVFNFSCGSGNGCRDAAKFLPVGSTLVNLTKLDDLYSYVADSAYIGAQSSPDRPYAENLFLNILANGYNHSTPIYPQITVASEDRFEGNTWSMWDAIRLESLEEEVFSPTFEAEAISFLADHFSADDIKKALRTTEFYMKAFVQSSNGYSSPDTPVVVRHRLDESDFMRETRSHGLFNVMCAVGYFANRPFIKAFNAGMSDTSLEPIRQQPMSSFVDSMPAP